MNKSQLFRSVLLTLLVIIVAITCILLPNIISSALLGVVALYTIYALWFSIVCLIMYYDDKDWE